MTIQISGSFPHPLYRGFDQEKHARSFLEEGSFFMRHLICYQNIEDPKRKDEDEGKGKCDYWMKDRPRVRIGKESGQILSCGVNPGLVHFHTQSLNPCYILCFHGPKVELDYLACQNRPYVVRVDKPDMLVCDIAAYLSGCHSLPNEMWLECVQVRYDRDQCVVRLPEPATQERLGMSYGQKSPKSSGDCEYRLVLTLPLTTPNPPQEIEIKLGKRLEYTEVVNLPTGN